MRISEVICILHSSTDFGAKMVVLSSRDYGYCFYNLQFIINFFFKLFYILQETMELA